MVSVPPVDSIRPELVMPTLLKLLVPVESSVPLLSSVPPEMLALAKSSVEPRPTVTVPAVPLVIVVEISFSVLLSIACSVALLVTASLMSSSPPLASSVPELTRVTTTAGSIVNVPPVDSIRPELVMPTLVMALVPVRNPACRYCSSVPPLMPAPTRSSVDPISTVTVPPAVLVTVSVDSFSVELLSIACSVPVLVTGSPVMSSSPPLASSVPELVRVTDDRRIDRQRTAGRSDQPELVMPALSMELVPVESSVPLLVSVPPLMIAVTRSSVEPRPTVTLPLAVLVTVVVVSFSVLLPVACSVPVLVTGSLVMSSSPPLASSVPELVRVTTTVDRWSACRRSI